MTIDQRSHHRFSQTAHQSTTPAFWRLTLVLAGLFVLAVFVNGKIAYSEFSERRSADPGVIAAGVQKNDAPTSKSGLERYALAGHYSLLSPFSWSPTLTGAVFPPPLGVNFATTDPGNTGMIGRPGGNTWYFSGIALPSACGDTTYWGPANNLVRLSFLNSSFANGSGEVLTFQPAQSNLAAGIAVWTGQTFNPGTGQPVYTKFTMTVNSHSGGVPGAAGAAIALTGPTTVGLAANVGALVPVTPGIDYQVNFRFDASFSNGSGYQPALDFYDANNTAGGTCFESFTAGFYYYNTLPTIGHIGNQSTPMNVPIGPLAFSVGDCETSPGSLAPSATSSNTTLVPNANIAFGGSGASRNMTITPATGETGTTTITYSVFDGIDTTTDSFVLTVNSPPTLGTYPDTTVALGANATVTPDAAPTDATSINVSSSTNFKGTFSADPATGVVRVTNAHPAGTYTVTVRAFNGLVVNTTKTFTLTVLSGTACAGASIFTNAADLSVGGNPLSVAIGDFNNDGKQDIAAANANSSTVSIRLGDGLGGFSGATNVSVGTSPWSVTIGDFNSDGKQDIAVANGGSNSVSIRLGDGTGGFTGTTNVSVGSGPFSVAIGDFNNDGKQDIAAANYYSNTVSIRLGDGAGGFTGTTEVSVGASPNSVAIGDFNNDGKQDIAVAAGSGTVSIRLGDGLGGFSGTTNVSVGSMPRSVAIGDFNNDGKQDIAAANYYSNTVSIRLGNGLGGFSSTTDVSVGSYPRSVAIGDFNNDGKQDIAIANEGSNTVSIRLGDGLGGFSGTTNVSVGSGPVSVAIGDFNGDGKQDFAAANAGSNTVSIRLGACNLPPTISDVPNQLVQRNQAFSSTLNIGDTEDPVSALTVTGTSNNQTLIPDANVVFSGSGPTRTLTVTPASNQVGTATITLTVTDTNGATATDTFDVRVNAVPVFATNTGLTLNQGATATITSAMLSVTDADNTAGQLRYTIASDPNGGPPHQGTLKLNNVALSSGSFFTQDDVNNNRLTYTHDDSDNTSDNFQFNITDGDGATLPNDGVHFSFSFGITITLINHAPVAVDGNGTTGLGAPFNGTFAATDRDLPAQTLTRRIVTNGTKGVAVLNNATTGAFTYTPNAGQTGQDTIIFQVNDGSLDSVNPGTFTITIQNQPPTEQNGSGTTNEGVALNSTLTASDPDQPPQPLTFAIAGNPTKGNVNITDTATGAFTYTPNANAFGADSFTFTASDGLLTSAQGTFSINIHPNFDAGDIFVTNSTQTGSGQVGSVIQIDPNNGMQWLVTTGGNLTNPSAIIIEHDGNLVVINNNSNVFRLVRINPATGTQSLIPTGPSFANPVGLGIGPGADIFVADPFANCVFELNPTTGASVHVFSGGDLGAPAGLAFDSAGNLLVSDAAGLFGGASKIIRINTATDAQAVVASGGDLLLPIDIDLDSNGDIMVSDAPNIFGPGTGKLIRVNPTTGAQTLITGSGLGKPSGVAVNRTNHDSYTPDNSGPSVLKTTSGGATATLATGEYLTLPNGIAMVRCEPNDAPVAAAGGPYTADLGSGFTLNGSGSSDPDSACGDSITNYSWDIDSGAVSLNGATPSLTAAQIDSLGVGSHAVSLTVTDNLGLTDTDSTTLTIYDNRPFASFTANPNPAACNQSISLNGSASSHGRPDRSIVSYSWDFGDGNIGSGVLVTHSYAAFGSYTATLTVTDNNVPAKTASASIVVTVSQGNQAPVSVPGGPYTADLGSGVTLDGSGSSDPNAGCGDSIVSYAWDVDNDGTFEFTGVTVPLSAAQVSAFGVGTRTIRLRVTDEFGASNTASATLNIYDNRPFASFTANPNPAACNQSISFNASASSHGRPDRSIVSYSWDFGDGNVGSGVAVTHAYSAYGTYTAKLTVTDNNVPAKTDFVTHSVSVDQGNQAPVSVPGGPYSTTVGSGISLDGSGSSDPNASCGDSIVQYNWSIDGGAVTASGANPSLPWAQISVLGVGSHTVSLAVTDTFGATGSGSTTLAINPPPPTFGPYPNTAVALGANATVTPGAAPTDTTSINVSTSTSFNGELEADLATGVVRVTNAHPAGAYTVTVKGFGPGGSMTRTFTLTVQTGTACTGASVFTNAADSSVGSTPLSVAIGDFNNDGKQDIAAANESSNTVSIRLGDGSGGFSGTTNVSVGSRPYSVAIGDFNNDGKQDFAVANVNSSTVSIRLGDGAGGFTGTTEVSVGTWPASVAIGDFNNDGKQDIAAANAGAASVSIRLGDGSGGFSGATNVGVGTNPYGVAIGDFNNDGKQDIAATNAFSNTVSIRLGNGDGTFTGTTNVGVGTSPSGVAIGDFDNDGKQDIAAANISSNTVSIRLGNGDGTFTGTTNVSVGTNPYGVAIGDFNNDGNQDFAAANFNSNTVSIRLGDGAGGFTGTNNVSVGTGPYSVAIGDFNGDGKQDFAAANQNSNNVSVRLGACNLPPTITAATGLSRQQGTPASNSQIATVTDDGGNGSVIVTVASTNPSNGVTISNIVNTGGNITADIIADCTATTATFTLQASDGSSTVTDTLTVTVTANTAPTLVYSSPQSVVFGGALNVSPTSSSDNGTVTYSVQSGHGLTTAPTVDASGVVSITNAQPAGAHPITIRETDNCGAFTDAAFTLNVGEMPTFAIDDVTHNEGNGPGTTSYVFTVTKTSSTALNSSVNFTTVDGTATQPGDYTLNSGTLNFGPTDTTMQITVLVNGDTNVEPNEAFTVHLSGASGATISDADGTGTVTNDDQPSISGHVTYANGTTPGKNVTMTLTGSGGFVTQMTTTDLNGDYSFVNIPAGNDYTLTPSKVGDIANGLQSFDAAFAARYVVGLDIPTASQRIAADADGDSILTSLDAALIARRAAGLPGFGIVGTWKFVPVNRSYSALGANQINQNFTAILVGDASGDWTPAIPQGEGGDGPSVNAAMSPDATLAVTVSLPHIPGAPGSTINVPITVGNLTGEGVKAYDLQVTFNPAIVQPAVTSFDTAGTISSGMLITPNATNPGHLIISAFQATDLSGSGTLINLRFTIVGAPGQVSTTLFQDYTDPGTIFHPGFRFNAGTPIATPTNGSIHVNGPTASAGTVSGRIVDGSGRPVEGATVRMGGTQNRLGITDREGNYRFDEVETGGFYTVTPSRANFMFTPSARSFSQLGENTEAAFTASADGNALNPLDTTEYFVRQQYLDFLSREPDEAGFNFWVRSIAACGEDAECVAAKRTDTSAAFFLSIEFQQTGYLVYRMYQSAYGDMADAPVPLTRAQFQPDTEVIGEGVVVNRTGWEAKLEANKQAFAAAFVARTRFTTAYPVGLTPAEFVDRLFANGGVTPDSGARTAAIGEFGGGSDTADVAARARVMRRVSENATLAQQEFNQAFVLMEYFGYLQRDANSGPDTDFSGYNFWLQKLNEFGGNFEQADMVRSFIVSGEYRERFPR